MSQTFSLRSARSARAFFRPTNQEIDVPLDALLQEILVDPEDKQTLWYFERDALLYNPRLKRVYPIRDGIPVLLIGESKDATEAQQLDFEARKGDAILTGSQ